MLQNRFKNVLRKKDASSGAKKKKKCVRYLYSTVRMCHVTNIKLFMKIMNTNKKKGLVRAALQATKSEAIEP